MNKSTPNLAQSVRYPRIDHSLPSQSSTHKMHATDTGIEWLDECPTQEGQAISISRFPQNSDVGLSTKGVQTLLLDLLT